MKTRTYTNKPKDKVHKQLTKSDMKNIPVFIIPNNYDRDSDSCLESEVDESEVEDLNELDSANQTKKYFQSCVKKQRYRYQATSNQVVLPIVIFTFIHKKRIVK